MKQKRNTNSQQPTAIDELQQQVRELTEALLRERADAMNVRRRAEEEKHQAANFYKTMILRELLPAIDNLERALMHVPKDLKEHDYVKGVQGVIKQFEAAFKELGMQRIKTVGEHFDPHLHEAVHMDEGDPSTGSGQEAKEVVSEELMPGYKLGDEVIRHAMVKVKMEKK